MSDIAIKVEGLSKLYKIGSRQNGYKTLRESITNAASAPFRHLSSIFNRSSAVGSPDPTVGGRRSSVDSETLWALKNISFEVHRGEVVGVIGRNGAGKSTLLKILSRITEPTEGYAEIRGRVGSLLEVGTGFHAELSGRENIYLSGAILGMRKAEIERKFDEIVAFAEIEKFIDTPVKHYSSGMYVRLAFAVAAHLDPEILLVDEVLAVGDAQFQKKCLGKMQNFAREGRTVLFVSHNMAAVQSLCSKAIQLEDGEVIASGNVDNQIQLYLDRLQDPSITTNLPIQVSAGINLLGFGFSPNPVQSCRKVNFFLELSSDRHLKLEVVAILIHSHLNLRTAVVDLRGREAYRIDEFTILRIEGWIKSLPLVDGQYRIHLYLKYEGKDKHLLDLVRLEVGARATKPNLVPLPAAARGIIELDTVFSANYG